MYTLLGGWLERDPYRFRVVNLVSSSLILILWVLSDPLIILSEIPFYFLGLLLINSLWINYLTSASEFHSVVLVIILILLTKFNSFHFIWIIQIRILMILIGGFKLVNAAYVIPVLCFNGTDTIEYKYWIIFGLTLLGLYTLWGLRSTYSLKKQYIATRRWFSTKHLKFILINPHFLVVVVVLGIGNILWTSWEWIILELVVWVIFIAQRNYLTYFFYPPLVLGMFIAFQTNWLEYIPTTWSWSIVLGVFVGHTVLSIMLLSPREIDIRFREWICLQKWRSYLDHRDRQIEWLQRHLDRAENVYLWGSNVVLLLLARLIHSPNTFYNHNHLFYWSVIEDKKDYAVNYVLYQKPKYIVESAVMNEMKFKVEDVENLYHLLGTVGEMSVYERF